MRAFGNAGRDLAHHKASLVKVVDALIADAVLSLCLLYQLEPAAD